MISALAASVPGGLPTLAALLVVTLLVANGVAAAVERARARRIADKTARLAAAPPPRAGAGAAAGPIPVTLLVGWLGAGKTTLLNRLLAAPQGRRLCVIENEAGSISIDHALLAAPPSGGGGDGSGRVTLPPGGVVVLKNGCLCCAAGGTGDELERVLDRLLALQEEGDGGDGGERPRPAPRQFDHVVIEASGLADPAPLVSTFFGSRQLGRRYALDSVVAVVDAKHIGRHLDGRGLLPRTRDAGRQVAYADTVVLTKTDVASPAEAAAAVAAIAAVNPTSRLLTAVNGDIDTAALLGQRAFDVGRARELLLLTQQQSGRAGGPATPVTAVHDREIRAVTVPLPHPVDQRRLQGWLQHLVSQRWEDLFRVKGLVWVTGSSDGNSAAAAEGRSGSGVAPSPRGGRRRPASAAGADATPGSAAGPARLLVIQGVHAELHASFAPVPSQAPPRAAPSSSSARRAGSPSSSSLRRRNIAADSDKHQHHNHHDHGHDCSTAGCDDAGHEGGTSPPELTTALVLIGRRLDEREVRASLAAAGLPPGT